jgi:arginine decarboxylase
MQAIQRAFDLAITESSYQNDYTCIYPIKVNQQRQVIEQIVAGDDSCQFGLEAGSKPELWAVVAMANETTPIICNGFKDAEFIEMALWAHKIGRNITPVIERYGEAQLVMDTAKRLGVMPQIGVRMKLAARGAGRWESSGGYRSKFGLTASEVVRLFHDLRSQGMSDSLKMLHFHLGSQVTNIGQIKQALNEAARVYVNLVKLGAPLEAIDVGGGLGVDYDGSGTSLSSSMNYTLQEYANNVIFHIQTVCDEARIPHPKILSESGRATVAYHSALVFEVLGATGPGIGLDVATEVTETDASLKTLRETFESIDLETAVEAFHDAQLAQETVMSLFNTGHLTLDERGRGESYFWAICRRIQKLVSCADEVADELTKLDRMLADTFFCNFSLFQSMPDSWAIDQLFPVMPIHRLDERPDCSVVLADITCDSDGKIDKFIDHRNVKRTLKLHEPGEESYYLGAFLIGAYQEILGDLHNLFGDTNAVHIDLGPSGEVNLATTLEGDSVEQVLEYVDFQRSILIERLQTAVENAMSNGRVSYEEARRSLEFYEDGLDGYTYLEEPGS